MNNVKTIIIAAMLTAASLAQAQTVTNVEDNPKRQSVFLEWGQKSWNPIMKTLYMLLWMKTKTRESFLENYLILFQI